MFPLPHLPALILTIVLSLIVTVQPPAHLPPSSRRLLSCRREALPSTSTPMMGPSPTTSLVRAPTAIPGTTYGTHSALQGQRPASRSIPLAIRRLSPRP